MPEEKIPGKKQDAIHARHLVAMNRVILWPSIGYDVHSLPTLARNLSPLPPLTQPPARGPQAPAQSPPPGLPRPDGKCEMRVLGRVISAEGQSGKWGQATIRQKQVLSKVAH